MLWFGTFLGVLLTIGGTYAMISNDTKGQPLLFIGIVWIVLMIINNIIYRKRQTKRIDTL